MQLLQKFVGVSNRKKVITFFTMTIALYNRSDALVSVAMVTCTVNSVHAIIVSQYTVAHTTVKKV